MPLTMDFVNLKIFRPIEYCPPIRQCMDPTYSEESNDGRNDA
jgi:hypothetical protein